MDNDSRLIFEALQSKVFTIVNGGTDNSAEHGFDINPVKHIQASDLKSAVNQMITKMAEDPDVEPEDINQTFPKEFREFREDHFVMSNDNGDWYYVFPGKLTDEQAYDRVLATGDYGSEDEEQRDVEVNKGNVQLLKQLKMLTNNALRNVFATIETLDNVDSIPYDAELHSLVVNLDEEVSRLMGILEDEKMPGKSEDEDAEHRSNAQNAAIAISLQKAGKKPS